MSNKSSSSSSNNHFHYHLYQYQTHNCCFNLFDHSKTSSTVTTAASNENYSSFHTQSIGNSYQTADFMQSRNTQHEDDKSKTATSSKFNENPSQVTSSGSEFPSTFFHSQSKVNFNPLVDVETSSFDDNSSKPQTTEKIIEVEFTNDNYKEKESEQDDCSCTKKYLPYKINEKNVWQVYETSDCKYIQSKYEIDEVFQPPESSKATSDYNPLLHSRSNFSNQVICHAINHDESHSENVNAPETDKSESVNSSTPFNLNSTNDSLYTPSFNIKSETVESCQCIDEETEDTASKVNDEDDDASVVSKQQFAPSSSKDSFSTAQPSGKLLNRPKATNNISRDQVQPVEKEVQNEITKNGVKTSSMRASKPIRLPSPVPKRQPSPQRNQNYDDDSETSEDEFSSIESQHETVKENKKSPKMKSNRNSPKDQTNARQQSSLMRQESKNVVIPNIHQGERFLIVKSQLQSSVEWNFIILKLSFVFKIFLTNFYFSVTIRMVGYSKSSIFLYWTFF